MEIFNTSNSPLPNTAAVMSTVVTSETAWSNQTSAMDFNITQDYTFSTTQGQLWILTEEQKRFAYINNIVYYSILVPLALCGNIFTLTAVIMVLRIKKSIPNLLIGVLASADLMSLIGCHILALMGMVQGSYPASPHWCNFQSMMSFSYFKLGFFTKCNISLDRFIALRYPLRYKTIVTTKKIWTIVVFNVVFAIGTSALTLYFDPEHIKVIDTWYMCTNNWRVFTEYKLVIVIIEGSVFMLGVIVFFIGNLTVISVMLKLNKKTRALTAVGKLSSTMTVNSKNTSLASNQNERETNNNGSLTPLKSRIFRRLVSEDEEIKKITTENFKPSNDHAKDNEAYTDTEDIKITLKDDNNHSSHQPMVKLLSPPGEVTKSSPLLKAINRHSEKRPSTSSIGSTESKMTNGKRNSVWQRAYFKAAEQIKTINRKQSKQRKELQFAKLVMVIVTVFVILWIPFMCVIYYEHTNRISLHPLVEDIAIKLLFANACVNPILYGVFNANFRRAYVYYIRMLCFYLTCKMTSKPSDSERKAELQGVFVKAQLAARFSQELYKTLPHTGSGSDLISNNRKLRINGAYSRKANSLPTQMVDEQVVKRMFDKFKRENESRTNIVIDSSVMRLAMQNIRVKSNRRADSDVLNRHVTTFGLDCERTNLQSQITKL